MKLEHTACNLCGKDDARVLFSRQDELTGRAENFRVVQCSGCGLVYVDPRPVPEVVGEFYPPEFVSYQFESVPPGDHAGWRRRLLARIAESIAAQRAKAVARFRPLEPGTKVLDIGCGKGGFLAWLARERGCEVTGVDFDEAAVQYCGRALGIRAIRGGTEEVAGMDEQFDLVTMWHFLEHDFNPRLALVAAGRLLRPGGLLVVEVPNVDSLENVLFGARSYLYDVPRHLYGFAPATLRGMVQTAGLLPKHIEFPTGAGGWVGSLQSVLSGGAIYRNVQRHLLPFLLLAQLALPPDFLAAKARRGSIMTLFATKP